MKDQLTQNHGVAELSEKIGQLNKGDKVVLTVEAFIKGHWPSQSRNFKGKPRLSISGVVKRISGRGQVVVQWGGYKTEQHHEPRFVERFSPDTQGVSRETNVESEAK